MDSGLDAFSHKPQDEARRGLETNLQTFQSSCDALEIQIVPPYWTLADVDPRETSTETRN
jgi:hypothetical protein